MMKFVVFLFLCAYKTCNGLDTFKIIGLFHNDEYDVQMPFKSVVRRNNLIGRRIYMDTIIESNIERNHMYNVYQKVCELLDKEKPIAAIFGPDSITDNTFLESLTSRIGIPYIHTTCYYPVSHPSETVLRLCPKTYLLSKAIAKIVDSLEWFDFVILYEDAENLIRLQEILKLQSYDETSIRNRVSVVRLTPGPDYRSLLKKLANTTTHQYILDCKLENVMPILKQAAEQKLMGSFKSFLITNLDAHTLNIKEHGWEANITTIRITDAEAKEFEDEISNWRSTEYGEIPGQISASSVKAQAALMHDAVQLFIDTLNDMNIESKHLSKKLACNSTRKWRYGKDIINNMKNHILTSSMTGPIEFDEDGDRSEFQIEIIEVNHDKVIATWFSKTPDIVYSNRSADEFEKTVEYDIKRTTVIVYSRIGAPYLMNRESKDGKPLEDNDRYEGFSMDLIKAISNFIGFNFRFEINQQYGSYNEKTHQWNGLIREVLDKRGHMAICDLTITKERRSVVDFSMPFMTLGISILMKKPEDKDESKLFAFMDPFGVEVWIYTITLYLIITVLLYFITRLNLADWENPHPCDLDNEETENIWDMKNCLWLTLGSMLTQGCDILPKGISSKTAVSMWWFFSLIISSTYTANLAAFMTKSRSKASVDNVEELAAQNKIKYGVMEGGATYAFFKGSQLPIYKKMFATMMQSKDVFCEDNNEGVSKVENSPNGQYAFFMESTTIEYMTRTKCKLQQIGTWLDTRRYGIAMPMNAPYRSVISNAVLKLQENGTIEKLKKLWWEEKREGETCPEDSGEEEESDALGLDATGGVFIVLFVGIIFAYIFGIMEFLWNVRNVSVDDHVSMLRRNVTTCIESCTYWEAFVSESKFALKVWVTKKTTSSESRSPSPTESNKNIVIMLNGECQ